MGLVTASWVATLLSSAGADSVAVSSVSILLDSVSLMWVVLSAMDWVSAATSSTFIGLISERSPSVSMLEESKQSNVVGFRTLPEKSPVEMPVSVSPPLSVRGLSMGDLSCSWIIMTILCFSTKLAVSVFLEVKLSSSRMVVLSTETSVVAVVEVVLASSIIVGILVSTKAIPTV